MGERGTVRAASRLTGLGEDQLDGIMARAVRDGLAQRATEATAALLEVLPPSSRTGVKAVTMDMSSAYVSAAQAALPGAAEFRLAEDPHAVSSRQNSAHAVLTHSPEIPTEPNSFYPSVISTDSSHE